MEGRRGTFENPRVNPCTHQLYDGCEICDGPWLMGPMMEATQRAVIDFLDLLANEPAVASPSVAATARALCDQIRAEQQMGR